MSELLLSIGLLLFLAVILGELSKRAGLSPLVGQVFAGIVAGPLLGIVRPEGGLEFFSLLGILILVFMIGMETRLDDIRKDVYVASTLAATGALLTFATGLLLGDLLFADINIGIVVGVAMISTSTAIPVKILMDRGDYHTRTGKVFIVMALADDIIAIIALSLLATYFAAGGVSFFYITSLFFAILGFVFLMLTAGEKFVRLFLRFFHGMRDEQIFLSIPLAVMFVGTVLSEFVGLAAVTGAFLMGMAMSTTHLKENVITPKIKILGDLVIPLFFAYSAIFIDINTLFSSWHIILIILIGGVLAKAVGSGLAARFFGFNRRSQRIIALGMIPRGEYGIVISQIALASAIITQSVYTILLTFIVLTVIITPILFAVEPKMGSNDYGSRKKRFGVL